MDAKCTCADCKSCNLGRFVTKSRTKQVLMACCDNAGFNYPEWECTATECKDNTCGDMGVLFDGSLCKGLKIPADHRVRYFHLNAYRLTKNDTKQQFEEEVVQSWEVFKEDLAEEYYKFISHHIEWVSNNRTRAELFDKKYSTLREGDVACHFDYSNNVPIESKPKTSGQWGNRIKASLGVVMCYTLKPGKGKKPPFMRENEDDSKQIEITEEKMYETPRDIRHSHTFVPETEENCSDWDIDDFMDEERESTERHRRNTQGAFRYHTKETADDILNERTIFCLSRDPNHDFCTALRMVEESITNTLDRAKGEGWTLRNYYGYSDQSGGEFHSTGFLYGLHVLRLKYKLNRVEWSYTCPNHGKGKHDGEGHVFKSLLRLGVYNGEVHYTRNEGFEITMKKYLDKKFAEYVSDRVIVNMSLKPAKHLKSAKVIRTWSGITLYSQFRDSKSHGFQRRFLDCKCDGCRVLCTGARTCECVCDNSAVVRQWSTAWKMGTHVICGGPAGQNTNTECFWYDTECRYNFMSKAQTEEFLERTKAEFVRQTQRDIGIAAVPERTNSNSNSNTMCA